MPPNLKNPRRSGSKIRNDDVSVMCCRWLMPVVYKIITILYSIMMLGTSGICWNSARLLPSPRCRSNFYPHGKSVPSRYETVCHARDNMPETDQDVLNWAKSSITEHLEAKSGREVEWSNTDLLKLCMLVSLEETASDGSLGDDVLFKSTWDLSLIKHYSIRIRELFMDMCQDIEGDLCSKSSYDEYAAKYPTHLVSAINDVLYEQQGYKRMPSYGDVSSFQLRRVLDSGVGSPILLAIIYMIVAEESGLSLHALSLEEGSYVVMWPKDDAIRLGAQGEVFVIDPYAKGSLMSAQEISEIFDVDVPFRPDSLKDMAEDTLLQLLMTHWCLAVQCPPEPLLAIPLDLDVALGEYSDVSVQVEYDDGHKGPLLSNRGDFWTVSPETMHHMQKCLSAAEKLHILQEGTVESTLRLALCQYFCHEYQKAIDSLDKVLQLCDGPQEDHDPLIELERIEVLQNKCRLLLRT